MRICMYSCRLPHYCWLASKYKCRTADLSGYYGDGCMGFIWITIQLNLVLVFTPVQIPHNDINGNTVYNT